LTANCNRYWARSHSWFLRLTAPVFSAPIAQLFNQSIDAAVVPTQWKEASIIPIPKLGNPTTPADYWPISFTPVSPCILEKRYSPYRYIYSAIQRLLQTHSTTDLPQLEFSDQFGFRPTGSTTAARHHSAPHRHRHADIECVGPNDCT
jgi:hypothetical protein